MTEVERLKMRLGVAEAGAVQAARERDSAQAEVERLRVLVGEGENWRSAALKWRDVAKQAEAEIERLWAELAQEKDVGLSIADSLGREAKRAEQAEARLAQVTQDYQTLRDAVNASGECTDPEHGEGCACHADVMIRNLQARLREVVEALRRHTVHGMYAGDAELLAAAQPEQKP